MSELTDRVGDTVMSIPAGRVMTYGAIAHENPRRRARSGAWCAAADVTFRAGALSMQKDAPIPMRPTNARAPLLEEATPLVDHSSDVRVDLARVLEPAHVTGRD